STIRSANRRQWPAISPPTAPIPVGHVAFTANMSALLPCSRSGQFTPANLPWWPYDQARSWADINPSRAFVRDLQPEGLERRPERRVWSWMEATYAVDW